MIEGKKGQNEFFLANRTSFEGLLQQTTADLDSKRAKNIKNSEKVIQLLKDTLGQEEFDLSVNAALGENQQGKERIKRALETKQKSVKKDFRSLKEEMKKQKVKKTSEDILVVAGPKKQ